MIVNTKGNQEAESGETSPWPFLVPRQKKRETIQVILVRNVCLPVRLAKILVSHARIGTVPIYQTAPNKNKATQVSSLLISTRYSNVAVNECMNN